VLIRSCGANGFLFAVSSVAFKGAAAIVGVRLWESNPIKSSVFDANPFNKLINLVKSPGGIEIPE